MAFGITARVDRVRIVRVENSFVSKNGNPSRTLTSRGKVTGNRREEVVVMRTQHILGGTFDLLGTDMIKSFRKMAEKPVAGFGTLSHGASLTDTERGEVEGDNIWEAKGGGHTNG